jgi:hypothetical protein
MVNYAVLLFRSFMDHTGRSAMKVLRDVLLVLYRPAWTGIAIARGAPDDGL